MRVANTTLRLVQIRISANFLSGLAVRRNVVAPSYTSLYHAVSFSHDGYDDARRKGVASEEQLWKVSVVAAIGLVGSAALVILRWGPALSGISRGGLRLLGGT